MKLTLVAIGQRPPAWARAAFDEFAKRFPPELGLDLKALKAEPRTAGKTTAAMMAAEALRIEAALPEGARRVVLDERGERRSTAQLAERLRFWLGDGRDVALIVGGPDGLDPALEGQRRRNPAPVGPDLAACLRARAAGRGAVPRLVRDGGPSLPPGMTRKHPFIYLASQSPRRAQLLDQLGVRHELLLADGDEDAEALEAERRGELPAAYVERVTRAKLRCGARAPGARAACPRRRSSLPTPRWRWAGASWASRAMRRMRARCCRRCRAARTAC